MGLSRWFVKRYLYLTESRHGGDKHCWKIQTTEDIFPILLEMQIMASKVGLLNWWKGKPSGSIACTRKQQPRFYWSCSSVVLNDATLLTPPKRMSRTPFSNVKNIHVHSMIPVDQKTLVAGTVFELNLGSIKCIFLIMYLIAVSTYY